jgi:TraC-like protein
MGLCHHTRIPEVIMAGTRSPRKRQTLDDIDAQIDALKAKRDEMERAQLIRFGALCRRAGLFTTSATEDELEAVLKEVAARFRKAKAVPAGDPGPADQPAATRAA